MTRQSFRSSFLGAILLLLWPALASAQTNGQYQFRYWSTGGGMTSQWVTPENGKAIGFTAGVPAMITVGGVAGGSNTQVQWNNAGAFGGIANATSDGTTLSMTSPAITTSITTPSTTFTAFAGATTLLTLGGTGATSTLVIPGTEAATGTSGVGALSVAGGAYFEKDVWIDGLYIGDGANSGSLSVVIGEGAHGSATTATTNIAIGNDALAASTNSSNNVAIGTRALEDIATGGGRNTAVGTLAGALITGGIVSNTTSSNSIYIGNGTRAFADGDTNEIVIGHSLTGEGSNTTTIGNSSTTAAHIYGALTAVGTGLTGTASGLTAGNVTTLAGQIVTKNTAASYTIGTTDVREFYGGVIYVTGAATITVPAVASGASFTVITIGAVAVSVDPNASDLIYLNGTALADGDKITNASTTGDMAVFTYYDGTGWVATTNSGWTDGN